MNSKILIVLEKIMTAVLLIAFVLSVIFIGLYLKKEFILWVIRTQ